jgi:glycopeptide antibiotics resistance protein
MEQHKAVYYFYLLILLFYRSYDFTYLFPNNYIFIWILGVCWEIVEFIFKDHPFYFSDCKYKLTTDKNEGWWYGRYEDIIVNTLGILLGYFLANKNI